MTNPDLRLYRGTIIDCENNVILESLPRIVEYTQDVLPDDINIALYDIYESLEGIILRFFHHRGEWLVHVGNQIVNASKYELDTKQIDEKTVCTLLLRPAERIVCDIVDDDKMLLISQDVNIEGIKKLKVVKIDDVQDMIRIISEMDYKNCQGLLLIPKDGSEWIRIFNREYHDRLCIRGKASSLEIRYLELRCKDNLDKFLEQYPEMSTSIVDAIEEDIYSFSKYLHGLYMQIYVKNDIKVKCTRDEKRILHDIHRVYVSTKQRTIPSRINDLLCHVHPLRLIKILDNYRKRKDERIVFNR